MTKNYHLINYNNLTINQIQELANKGDIIAELRLDSYLAGKEFDVLFNKITKTK